jgi:HPt (histidine-containing phosphotransfer) domain-containing protein
MTAHAMKEHRQQCLDAGMDDYVSKPISPAALFEAIDRNVQPLSRDREPAAEAPASLEQDIFDKEACMVQAQGDPTFFKEMLDLFIADTHRALNNLTSALDSRDAERIRRFAHDIKNAAGIIHAKTLMNAAHKLELAGKASDMADALGLINDMKAEFDKLCRIIAEF